MIAKLLSVDEILVTDADMLKYVRVGDEFRFVPFNPLGGPSHKDMLDEGEIPVNAGFCTINVQDRKVKTFGESLTLHLYPALDDAERLTALFFGKGFTNHKAVV